MVFEEKSSESEIAEHESLVLAMYHMIPNQFLRVVNIEDVIGVDMNQATVRKMIHENTRTRWAKKPTETQKELKHLSVLRMAVMYMLICVLNLYEYTKKKLGPLGSVVGTIEVALITTIGPLYRKFRGVPDDCLAFLDMKVDEAASTFDRSAPHFAKGMMYRIQGLIQKAFKKTQTYVNKAQTEGVCRSIHYADTDCNQLLLNLSVKLWAGLEYQCSPIHTVAEKATPVAVYLCNRYNHVVRDLKLNDCTIFRCLPLVPVDEILTALNKARQEVGVCCA